MEVSRSISCSSITNLDEEEKTMQDSQQSASRVVHMSHVHKKEQKKRERDKTSTRVVLHYSRGTLHSKLRSHLRSHLRN